MLVQATKIKNTKYSIVYTNVYGKDCQPRKIKYGEFFKTKYFSMKCSHSTVYQHNVECMEICALPVTFLLFNLNLSLHLIKPCKKLIVRTREDMQGTHEVESEHITIIPVTTQKFRLLTDFCMDNVD